MKNVLIISDSFLSGGLETRLTEQFLAYQRHNIKIYLACESFQDNNRSHLFEKILTDINFSPKNGCYKAKDILKSVDNICDFCKKNNIDFIECQPFWCLIPATIVSLQTNIPLSYTLHGTASGNFIDPIYYEANLLYYLCLSSGTDQIFAVSERLAKIYNYISDKIIVSRNNIDLKHLPSRTFQKTGRFATASRLDGPKTEVIINFIPKIYRLKQVKQFDIYGNGDKIEELKKFITSNHFDDKVNILGWSKNLIATFINEKYDCVFGVGRIITDAISSTTPVGILGYGGFAGLINKYNLLDFAETNFLSWETFPDDFLKNSILNLYKNPSEYLFSKQDLSIFDTNKNWNKHISLEQNLKPTQKPIIEKIEKLLKNNPNENLLLDTDIIKNLNHILPEQKLIYSGLLNSLFDILHAQIIAAESRTKKLEDSLSWKVTKPLRKANKFFKKS